MKSFAIGVGLVMLAVRAEAQHLVLRMGQLDAPPGAISFFATDFGVVRVVVHGALWTREIDAQPLAARDFARALLSPLVYTAAEAGHPERVRATAQLAGRGGQLTVDWPAVDAHAPRTLVAAGSGAEPAVRVEIPANEAVTLRNDAAHAAREAAALSLSPTGIDSASAGTYAFEDYQVEYAAQPDREQASIPYPSPLLQARVEGVVVARFVVTARGDVDTSRVQVLRSTHELFTAAVKGALAHQHYFPARIGERPVAQWVHKTFSFRLPPS